MLNTSPIKYFKGTHRIKNPEKTLEEYEDKLKIAGITRVTDITDLDRVGIPVFSAIRPTAQSGGVSIYAGKGITKTQAKASAIMEGFERYSAEKQNTDKNKIGTIKEMENPIDLNTLILPQDTDKEQLPLDKFEWSEMTELNTKEKYDVPSNFIYHPYVLENNELTAIIKGNTNGLASGNNMEEAILHGIFEVIERDAWSIFEITKKNKKEIDIETIKNKTIKETIEKFEKENIKIKLFDITADIQIPTILASSDDTLLKDAALLSIGVGTHLNPEIAVLRALTEVAQSRATQIHGTREDTSRADFMRKAGYDRMKKINKIYFEESSKKIKLEDIEDKSSENIKTDIETCLKELKNNKLEKVLMKDLTREETKVNVVRIIIPKAELYALDPTRRGERSIQYDKNN